MKTERRGAGQFYTELASIEMLTMKDQRAVLSAAEGSPAVVITVADAINALSSRPESAAAIAKLRDLPPGTHLLAFT